MSNERGDEKFRLYSISELLSLPSPKWLIENLFTLGALVVVYGAAAHGKSFLALDWALSVAHGALWQGRTVQQGSVVYVAAEGGASIRRRVAAWMQEHDCAEIPAAFFLLESVNIRNQEDLELLISRIRNLSIEPVLIVVDTLARCFGGGDENTAQEMGEFIDGLERLKKETGATMLAVHHTGKESETERGSSALRAAADTMIYVRKTKTLIVVKNNKQKDDEEFREIRLHLKQVLVDGYESIVLEATDGTSVAIDSLPSSLRDSLRALADSPRATTTTAEWAGLARLKERTLHSHRKSLVEAGYVDVVRKGIYVVTETGRAALEPAATAKQLHLVKK